MLSEFVDATLLRPEATLEEYEQCIAAAVKWYCRGLVLPTSILTEFDQDIQALRYKWTKVATVIGYPLGNESVEDKLRIMRAYQYKVDEFDVVLNLTYIKSGQYDRVREELIRLCEWNKYPYQLKIIIEAPLLTFVEMLNTVEEIITVHQQYPRILAIKTATGRHGSTTSEQVRNIRQVLDQKGNNALQIKVSGGVKTVADVKSFDPYGVQMYGVGYPNFMTLLEEAQQHA